MSRCTSCSAELQPEWKYCIHCGTKVPAAPPVPPAIRHDFSPEMWADDAADAPRRQVTVLGLFGWSLGTLLVALAVVAAVVLNS